MRRMGWSWSDLCELPAFHLDVLYHMLESEAQSNEHQHVLEESRRNRGW